MIYTQKLGHNFGVCNYGHWMCCGSQCYWGSPTHPTIAIAYTEILYVNFSVYINVKKKKTFPEEVSPRQKLYVVIQEPIRVLVLSIIMVASCFLILRALTS